VNCDRVVEDVKLWDEKCSSAEVKYSELNSL
jgi:hypothetical protein